MAFSTHPIFIKVVAAAGAALAVSAGTVVMQVDRDQAVQDLRITTVERALTKLDDIDRTVQKVDGKVDVLNQKLDDAKDALGVGHDRSVR